MWNVTEEIQAEENLDDPHGVNCNESGFLPKEFWHNLTENPSKKSTDAV